MQIIFSHPSPLFLYSLASCFLPLASKTYLSPLISHLSFSILLLPASYLLLLKHITHPSPLTPLSLNTKRIFKKLSRKCFRICTCPFIEDSRFRLLAGGHPPIVLTQTFTENYLLTTFSVTTDPSLMCFLMITTPLPAF